MPDDFAADLGKLPQGLSRYRNEGGLKEDESCAQFQGRIAALTGQALADLPGDIVRPLPDAARLGILATFDSESKYLAGAAAPYAVADLAPSWLDLPLRVPVGALPQANLTISQSMAFGPFHFDGQHMQMLDAIFRLDAALGFARAKTYVNIDQTPVAPGADAWHRVFKGELANGFEQSGGRHFGRVYLAASAPGHLLLDERATREGGNWPVTETESGPAPLFPVQSRDSFAEPRSAFDLGRIEGYAEGRGWLIRAQPHRLYLMSAATWQRMSPTPPGSQRSLLRVFAA